MSEIYQDVMINSDLKNGRFNEKNFDLAILRNKHKPVIWNCTFYFLEIGLPYDFMFPYVDYDYYIGFEEENNSA